MKRIAPLFLLPLLLAACGQPSAPKASAPRLSSGPGHAAPVVPNYIARFEAGVERDLAALGLGGSLSTQGVAPKSYLNVLRVNDSTARAYLKTTFPTATGCMLDWGDGSSEVISTPSTSATDKQNHNYTQSGNYTITLTCGTTVKTSSFQATVASAGMGFFDDYVGEFNLWEGGEETWVENPYITKGLLFSSEANYMERNGWGLPQNHIGLALTCNYGIGQFYPSDGSTFDITSISASSLYDNYVKITGYDGANQIIGTASFTSNANQLDPIETKVLNWKNVSRVVCSDSSYLLIDDMDVTINPHPI